MKSLLLIILALPMVAFATDHWGAVTDSVYSATASSTKALASNGNRKYLLIQNNGASTVTVTVGAAQSSTEGAQIIAGGNWEPPTPPIDSIYVKSAAGVCSLSIIEGQ